MVVPVALVTSAAILLLGPPLGHALLAPGSDPFWPGIQRHVESVEHARFVIAVLAAPLLSAAIVASGRRPIRRSPVRARLLTASQLLACAFLALCLLAQHDILLRSHVSWVGPDRIFIWRTVAVAALLVLLLVAGARRADLRARVAGWAREERTRRRACLALAVLATAVGFLAAVSSDASVGNTPGNNLIPWDMSETFAVLDGRTPFVDFHVQYAQLWPYLAAAVMALVGATVTVWTTLMATLSGAAMVAIYSVLRRIVHSSSLALALYVPFLATTLFKSIIISPATIFSIWPLRIGGPYLLVWLTARHVDGVAPRRAWLLFVAAGLVLLNNAEFGAAAFLATIAALACTATERSWRRVGRLLAAAAVGLLAAALLVAALTLARSGRLPDFALLSEFSRIYGIDGWVLEPMTPIGLHVAVYATFVAAVAVATVRALRGGEQPVLTGMLAWSGSFGLVAGGYYAGRSDALSLISLLSPWALALVLLFVVVVRALDARGWRRPAPAELAVLFGVGLAVCSLPQLPTPWSQVARLRHRTPTPVEKQPAALRLVASATRRGQKVVILIPLGHRIAYDLGLTNIAPYAGMESMPTVAQLEATIALARREHVHRIFISSGSTKQEELNALFQAGFALAAKRPPYYELADVRAPARAP